MLYAYHLTPDAGPFPPRDTDLAEALDVLVEAARVAQEQHADWAATDPWGAVTLVTGGRLLTPA
ncbi:hypothetical protein [Streptomyces sp. WM6378]|uniref:hypothetical protein n=1 Tax=Streptomyces sp. WM6378 TaxID=1415557 RepID=UPI0006AED9F7|nr:hypothetical protein [Streptomyces sp. WM6378]KOU36439.1 hypothetical protein ADK54_33565 [Streptomyces sp. WM6378]